MTSHYVFYSMFGVANLKYNALVWYLIVTGPGLFEFEALLMLFLPLTLDITDSFQKGLVNVCNISH